MKTNIGIPDEHLRVVGLELNKLLADEVILFIKTRNYHWNYQGSSFKEMHSFYESQSSELDDIMDETAERIRTIGHYAAGRLVDYLKLATLVESQSTSEQVNELNQLLNDHETIITNLRRLIPLFADEHKDIGTSDFITQLLVRHEKMAWMIRAYLT